MHSLEPPACRHGLAIYVHGTECSAAVADCSYMNCRALFGDPVAVAAACTPQQHFGNRDFFCRAECYDRYYQRTTTGALRERCWDRDQGICKLCEMDTETLVRQLQHQTVAERKETINNLQPPWSLPKSAAETLCSPLRLKTGLRSRFWEADHKVP